MNQEKMLALLKAKLREKRLKVTRKRVLVLQVLAENGGSHMAAENIL